jgi:hypothetical protein
MSAVWDALYLLVLAFVGAGTTCAIVGRRRTSVAEIVALIMTLGLGVTGMLLIWLSMLGLRPGRAVILAVGLIASAGLSGLIWRRRFPQPIWPARDRKPCITLLSILPATAILGLFMVALILSVSFPTVNWDSVVIWGMKARIMYFYPLTPRPWYFDDVRFSYSHLDYPLLAPMMFTGAFGMMQEVNDQAARIVLPLIYAGQILLVYIAARLLVPRLPALLITLVASCPQFILPQASTGSADVPLSMFRAGTLLYLLRWWDRQRRQDAILCGLFTLFAAMTKSEGLPLALITAALFVAPSIRAIRDREIRTGLAMYLSILAVGLGIWFIWKIGIPQSDENYLGRLRPQIIFGNLARIGPILATMARTTTHLTDWGVLWLLIPAIAAIGYPAFRETRTRLLWAMLVLHLALYVFVYVITPWDLEDLMSNSLNRLLIHIAPTAALVLAAHWAAVGAAEHRDMAIQVPPTQIPESKAESV